MKTLRQLHVAGLVERAAGRLRIGALGQRQRLADYDGLPERTRPRI